RYAAAVVGDRDETVGADIDLDPAGVACDGLVHGIVDDLGEKVMQSLFIGPADVHARTPAHRLQPLEDLDIGSRIAVAFGTGRLLQGCGLLAPGRVGNLLQIIHLIVEGGEKVVGLGRAFGHAVRASQGRIKGKCDTAESPGERRIAGASGILKSRLKLDSRSAFRRGEETGSLYPRLATIENRPTPKLESPPCRHPRPCQSSSISGRPRTVTRSR